jgi:excisionase family DNA binding protein
MKKLTEEVPDKLWTTQEVARFLGIGVNTLYQWTYKRTGPKTYKIGKYTRYKPSEVLDWLNRHAIP